MFYKGKVKINIFLLPQDPDLYLTDLLLFQQKAKAFFSLQIIPLFKNMNLLFVSFEILWLFFHWPLLIVGVHLFLLCNIIAWINEKPN